MSSHPKAVKLGQLIEGLECVRPVDPRLLDREIRNVTDDSRSIQAGSLYVAVRGTSCDGHVFVDSAKEQGAIVLGEEMTADIQVSDSRRALGRVAARFYGDPSRSLLMVGVTGTSGKTTTTYLIESILKAAGKKVGVIGTVSFRTPWREIPSTHTTPGAIELHRLLATMKEEGCDAVVMEVSSHALKQRRVASVAFDAVVFNNLSPEHLDYHADMEDYFQSKAILFEECVDYSIQESGRKRVVAVINVADEYGRRLSGGLKNRRVELDLREFSPLAGSGLKIGIEGIQGEVSGVSVESPLLGEFNAANVLAALETALGLGVSPQVISLGLKNLKEVPGRLERVPNDRGIHVLVDYAHKPDALEKVLTTLGRLRGTYRLICVMGCGGDRDRAKRPEMGRIAIELADHVIVTSDNPRTEDPEAIIAEILVGITEASRKAPAGGFFEVEVDRTQAIAKAVGLAKPGDIVLIAGKGHETYQIIRGPGPKETQKIDFDDREVAARFL